MKPKSSSVLRGIIVLFQAGCTQHLTAVQDVFMYNTCCQRWQTSKNPHRLEVCVFTEKECLDIGRIAVSYNRQTFVTSACKLLRAPLVEYRVGRTTMLESPVRNLRLVNASCHGFFCHEHDWFKLTRSMMFLAVFLVYRKNKLAEPIYNNNNCVGINVLGLSCALLLA